MSTQEFCNSYSSSSFSPAPGSGVREWLHGAWLMTWFKQQHFPIHCHWHLPTMAGPSALTMSAMLLEAVGPGQLLYWCSSKTPAMEPDPIDTGRSYSCPSRLRYKGQPSFDSRKTKILVLVGCAIPSIVLFSETERQKRDREEKVEKRGRKKDMKEGCERGKGEIGKGRETEGGKERGSKEGRITPSARHFRTLRISQGLS